MADTTAPVPQTSLIKKMAAAYGLEPTKFRSTIVKTLFPSDKQNVSDEVVAAFLVVADKYALNPFTKEIYAFPGKGGGIVPIVSIDGWNTLINRQPMYDGVEFQDDRDEQGNLIAITAKVYRKDRSHPMMVTEYMAECKRTTDPWKSHPARMLRHRALIQAARYAFGLSGIYDPDEGERIAQNGGGLQDVPVPVAVISEQQRVDLVQLATAQGVVEKLGFIVEQGGFEMVAYITVDRYDDIINAIKAAAKDAKTIDAEVIDSGAGAEAEEPTTANDPDGLDPEVEDIRAHVQELLSALPPPVQKDLLAGKPLPKKMNLEELEALKDAIEAVAT